MVAAKTESESENTQTRRANKIQRCTSVLRSFKVGHEHDEHEDGLLRELREGQSHDGELHAPHRYPNTNIIPAFFTTAAAATTVTSTEEGEIFFAASR